ncbi:MAG: acyl-CoA dehydrogenase family protein [Acidimicrobiia bacterium]
MNTELSEEAREYGEYARRAFESAGGDELIQAAEREPERRDELVASVFTELGAWDLDPRESADDLEAAAALCRGVGYAGVAYPVAERLARPLDLDADGLVVVADHEPAAALAGVAGRWAAVTLDGERSTATSGGMRGPARYAAFVAPLDLAPLDGAGAGDVPLALVLPCWTLLGMLDRALDVTREYVRERHQFGQALASFQGVQFQLTDAELERLGLEELAKYALWSSGARPDDALADALALRLAAIEAADVVFRVAHQLHGAIGFCDETMLSWLSRYSQPLRRLPLGLSATRDELTRRIGTRGLTGLFDDAESAAAAFRVSEHVVS